MERVYRTQLATLRDSDLDAVANAVNLHYEDLAEVFGLAARHWLETHPGDNAYLAHLAGLSAAFGSADDWSRGGRSSDRDARVRAVPDEPMSRAGS